VFYFLNLCENACDTVLHLVVLLLYVGCEVGNGAVHIQVVSIARSVLHTQNEKGRSLRRSKRVSFRVPLRA